MTNSGLDSHFGAMAPMAMSKNMASGVMVRREPYKNGTVARDFCFQFSIFNSIEICNLPQFYMQNNFIIIHNKIPA